MDRITTIQSGLEQLSSTFFTAIGVLQRDAAPVVIADFHLGEAPGAIKDKEQNDHVRLAIRDFTGRMMMFSKELDVNIDALRAISTVEEEQLAELAELEKQNEQANAEYAAAAQSANALLSSIRTSIETVSNFQKAASK